MRSLSESRRGSKVTNNLFLVILESAIVCVFFCLFLCEIVDRFDFRRSLGRSAGSFPEQRLIEPRLGRYFWPLFVVTFHGVGSGFARWETLVNFYRWVIDGYASKHNNHDRLYCGNLHFWPPCVEFVEPKVAPPKGAEGGGGGGIYSFRSLISGIFHSTF